MYIWVYIRGLIGSYLWLRLCMLPYTAPIWDLLSPPPVVWWGCGTVLSPPCGVVGVWYGMLSMCGVFGRFGMACLESMVCLVCMVGMVCMPWMLGIVWMVGMVCKSVVYGMFDMTVCMVCMVCMVTMMGMECFLCKCRYGMYGIHVFHMRSSSAPPPCGWQWPYVFVAMFYIYHIVGSCLPTSSDCPCLLYRDFAMWSPMPLNLSAGVYVGQGTGAWLGRWQQDKEKTSNPACVNTKPVFI